MRKLSFLLMAGLCSCQRSESDSLPASSSAGTLDKPAVPLSEAQKEQEDFLSGRHLFKESDPSVIAETKLPAQVRGKFVSMASDYSRYGEFLRFFPKARSAGWPGICEVEVLAVSPGDSTHIGISSYVRYAIAGSVASQGENGNEEYGARLDKVCSSRRDMRTWFSASDAKSAYLVAQMVDAAIYASHQRRPLGFMVTCPVSGEKNNVGVIRCKNPRAALAEINPRAIIRGMVDSCPHPRADRLCITAEISMTPQYRQSNESDIWILKVAGRYSLKDSAIASLVALDSVVVTQESIIFD